MPHQCVRCGTFYDDGSVQILKGCPCGAKLFFYVSKEKLEKAKQATEQLTKDEKKEIEHEVLQILDEKIDQKPDTPVILDFEAIKVLKPGKFELDLIKLFKNEPVVFKLEDGKYIIDLTTAFRSGRKQKKKRQ